MFRHPNIVLIVMDAVRADHLSCYGYPRPTTPFLEELAADGVLFGRAFAAAPWTPPSHASLFTGTYPSTHGVDVAENLCLPGDHPTLAQILAAHGYRTFALLSSAHLGSARGFHRGFQDYVEAFRFTYRKPDLALLESLARNLLFGRDKRSHLFNRVTKRWLASHADTGAPFFVFINYITAHNRYQSPWPFRQRFEIAPGADQDRKKLDHFSEGGGYPYMAGNLPMSERDFEVMKSRYDGAIACIDARIRDLVDFLKSRKVYDNTLILVTADHGEHFGEHGLAYHLFSLSDTLIRVPLLLHCPALFRGPLRVSELASLTDVLPTLLDILGLDAAGLNGSLQGRSLLPFDGRPPWPHVFAEFDRPTWMFKNLAARFPGHDFSRFDRGLKCVRTAEYKLVVGSDGTEELYHLPTDPGETRDVRPVREETARELRSVLDRWSAAVTTRSSAPTNGHDDDDVTRNLRELGYL